ncbi:RDD family protein [Mycolicibacterium vanbaalenii]|uniref:RDD family protein n=1 Tax=Mycolicibacterium vanbaalenii TaxID=110539 RepID=UPI00132F53D3|nr:RDD family protein [Mycolicibacterium vanbaalenii]
MTDQPPPPGSYPPAPPPPGGQPVLPPPGSAGVPLPQESYTPWLTRVLAWVIDAVPVLLIQGIGWGLLVATRETVCVTDTSGFALGEFCGTGASTLGQSALVLAVVAVLAYVIWNLGYRQGTTGSSVGKAIMKFQVVSENTWQPIGFGRSIVRQLAHIIDGAICYIGYLFPLWDNKRQTIADKIMTTVCIPL